MTVVSPTVMQAIRPATLREWRDALARDGVDPVVIVAGARGKSTIIRLYQHILRGLARIAVRDAAGVRIGDLPQNGEIEPWTRVLADLSSGGLDLALWEADWPSVSAIDVQRPGAMAVVSNVCANREECLITEDADRARRALPALARSLASSGVAIVNGEDHLALSLAEQTKARVILVGSSLNAPAMRAHWQAGGVCSWIEDGTLCLGSVHDTIRLISVRELPFALDGHAAFQVQNAQFAASMAYASGVRVSAVAGGLRTYGSDGPATLDAFAAEVVAGVTVILDRPAPSWYLKPIVRAVRDASRSRILTIVGRATRIPEHDLTEVGRMLGRISAVLMISTGRAADGYRWDLLRDGAIANDLPPIVLPFANEQAAFRRALSMARSSDTIVVLTEQPRLLQHHLHRTWRRLETPAGQVEGSATP